MKVRAAVTTILAFVMLGFIAGSAVAEEVSIKGHNKDQIQGKCSDDGDVFWV